MKEGLVAMTKLVEPLLPLQDLDLKIHAQKVRHAEKPRELASYEEKKKHATEMHAAIKEEINELRKEGSRRELEVKELEAKVLKITIQSNTAKKNEDYHALLKEISGHKADQSRIEDSILDVYMQVDEKSKLEKVRLEEVHTVEKEFLDAQSRIEGEMSEIQKEIEALLEQRENLTKEVDLEVLQQYDRILESKDDGLAVATLQRNVIIDDTGKAVQITCGGCHVNINAQDVNQTLLGRNIVRCRACSRILYADKTVMA